MKRSHLILISVFLCLILGLTALGAASLKAESQTQGSSQNQTTGASALTPDQVEAIHSKLYRGLFSLIDKNGNPIPEIPRLLASTSGDIHLQNHEGALDTVPMTNQQWIAHFACYSDLVVVGTTGVGISHMTADSSFLYTDWGFLINQIFKNNSNAPVQVGSSITSVVPGGELSVQGRMVYARDDYYGRLAAGRQYLLFLVSIPNTGTYRLSEAFELTNGRLNRAHGPISVGIVSQGIDRGDLLTLTQNAVKSPATDCKGGSKQ